MNGPWFALAACLVLVAGCSKPSVEPTLEVVVQGIPSDDEPAHIIATLWLPKKTVYHDQGCGDQPVLAWVASEDGQANRHDPASIPIFPASGAPLTACVEQDVTLPSGNHVYDFVWDGRDAQGNAVAAGPHDVLVEALAGRLAVHATIVTV